MVQNMLRTHPQFANNPNSEQMLQEITNNPAMLAQLSQMMQDPAMRSRMQAMTQNGGGFGGSGFGNMGAPSQLPQPPIGNTSSNAQGQQPSSGVADEQSTEEEMIAEAIRRSLQEG
jgi:hypothetical protein